MRSDTTYDLILRVDYYVCLSRYRRIGQCRSNLADTIKMAMFSQYVWILLSRGLVRRTMRLSRITRGRRTYTKPSVHVGLKEHRRATPLFAGAEFLEEIFGYSSLNFWAVQHPAATCATHFVVARRKGDAFRRVQSTIKSSFCGCLRFSIIPRSFLFLVHVVGPVLGTSISRKSGIIGVYLSQFSRIAPFLPGHFRK